MTALVDTHAHIDLPIFDEDRQDTLHRASQVGVMAIVAIGHNPERWETTRALAKSHRSIVRTAGVHPNDASLWNNGLAERLDHELRTREPVAVGETGLDFYRDSVPAGVQREAFVAQIALARAHDLPIVIHQREAEDETLALVREHGPVRGVMHCFSGDAGFARACLDLGLLLGVGGVATYPKSFEVRDAIRESGLNAVVLETDAPYLAPQPRRGRRNEPAFVAHAAESLAELFHCSIDVIAERTTATAIELFGPRLEVAVRASASGGTL